MQPLFAFLVVHSDTNTLITNEEFARKKYLDLITTENSTQK